MSIGEQGETRAFLDISLEKTARIEQALGHLAKAIELELVDVALQPELAANGHRENFVLLAQKLAEISGISYTLVSDIATTTGIPMKLDSAPDPEVVEAVQPTLLETPALSLVETDSELDPLQPEDTPAPEVSEPDGKTVTSPESDMPDRSEQTSTREFSLYDSIVNPASLPEMREVDETEAINAEIHDNNTIRLKGEDITLKGDELFLFNALLMLRDKPRGAKELKALGFKTEGRSTAGINQAFSVAARRLSERLNTIAHKEIIKKLGERRSTQYAFNPRFVLTEMRHNTPEIITLEGVKKN